MLQYWRRVSPDINSRSSLVLGHQSSYYLIAASQLHECFSHIGTRLGILLFIISAWAMPAIVMCLIVTSKTGILLKGKENFKVYPINDSEQQWYMLAEKNTKLTKNATMCSISFLTNRPTSLNLSSINCLTHKPKSFRNLKLTLY